MDVAARVGSQGGINSMMDQCQAGGGEGKGEAVQRKASWTARDTKRKNKCCWTGLHTAKSLIERNEEHIRHSK